MPSARSRLQERARAVRIPKLTVLEKIVVGLWVVQLMDPQFLVATVAGTAALQAPTPFYFIIGLAALLSTRGRREMAMPLLALAGYVALTTPFAVDKMQSFAMLKMFVIIWLLAVGTMGIIKTPQRALMIVTILMVWQYLWWGLIGVRSGLVDWDPVNANYDGYGPLMAGGIAAGAFFGLAVKRGKLKWVALFVAGLSLVALMSSFARGAVLSGIAVIAVAWLRSPRKGAMTGGIVAAVALVSVLSVTVFSHIDRGDANSNFLTEMSSIVGALGDPANDVEGTAQDRHAIWVAAQQLYIDHPVFGVGAGGFGPAAASEFRVGELAGPYGDNPGMLWGKALHNVYYQVLSELGTIGFILLLWVLVDFAIKNSRIRSPAYRAAWDMATGGTVDLQYVALGLEAIIVGWAVSAYFYNQLSSPWFYGTIIANMLLHHTLTQWIAEHSRGNPRRGSRSVWRSPGPPVTVPRMPPAPTTR